MGEPCLSTGGRTLDKENEVFVGLDVAKRHPTSPMGPPFPVLHPAGPRNAARSRPPQCHPP